MSLAHSSAHHNKTYKLHLFKIKMQKIKIDRNGYTISDKGDLVLLPNKDKAGPIFGICFQEKGSLILNYLTTLRKNSPKFLRSGRLRYPITEDLVADPAWVLLGQQNIVAALELPIWRGIEHHVAWIGRLSHHNYRASLEELTIKQTGYKSRVPNLAFARIRTPRSRPYKHLA